MNRFILAACVSATIAVIATATVANTMGPALVVGIAAGAGWFVIAPRTPLPTASASVGLLIAVASCVQLGLSPALALGGVWGLAAPTLLQRSASLLARVQTVLLSLAGASISLWLSLYVVEHTVTMGMASLTLLTAGGTLLGAAPLYWQPRRQRPTQRHIQVQLNQPYRPAVQNALRLTERGIPLAPDRVTADGLDEVCAWVFRLQQTAQQLHFDLSLIDEAAARTALTASGDTTSDDAYAHQRRTHQHHRQVLHHCDVLRTEVARTESTVAFAQAWLADTVAGLSVARARPDDAVAPDLQPILDRLRAHGDVQEAHRRTRREFATPMSA